MKRRLCPAFLYVEGTNGSGPAEKLARTVMHAVAEYDRSSLVARLAAARACARPDQGRTKKSWPEG